MKSKIFPKITVVTPSYNQANYLEETICSVLNQNYQNLEYIIMDGGSNDGSVDIIKKYESKISYWQSTKDNGQSDAIFNAFEMATGEIFCWLNSDDILLPNSLQHVAQIFDMNPEVGFVYGNSITIDIAGNVIAQHIWPRYLTKYHWVRGQYLAQECCFWRASSYKKVGGLNKNLYFIMDFDLFYRLWRIVKFKKISNYLGCYRVHSETKNTKDQAVRLSELNEACIKYNLEKPGYFMVRFLDKFDNLLRFFENLFQKR